MKNLMLYIVCLILGMLIYNMIKNLSSCKIVEGSGHPPHSVEHIEVRASNTPCWDRPNQTAKQLSECLAASEPDHHQHRR